MDYPHSSQQLMLVGELRIVATFKYPKYLPISDQSVFRARNVTLIANASHIMKEIIEILLTAVRELQLSDSRYLIANSAV